MGEVDVVGKLLRVKGLFVVLHQVRKVRVPRYLRQHPLLLTLLQVVLRPVVLVLRQDLFVLHQPILTFID